jgi:DNA polymerase-3 subunit gamma/tau
MAHNYLVLARKWRPQTFDDLLGQGHVARTLSNAIKQGRVAHGFLFAGVRGVGKTSAARILAKALTCRAGPTPTPCGTCDACTSIANGSATDVQEIDGASNNSVEDVRRLRENVVYQPSTLRYRIYIIDEVHMLSQSAFNALLKTLEEPPPHVKFVFATTEPHKIPVTILSRCQRYDFRRIATRQIAGRIEQILADESIVLEPAAVRVLAEEAGGSMRDALSLLDQVLAAFPAGASAAEVTWLLGVTPQALLHRVAAAVVEHDARGALDAVREADDSGNDLQQFARSFLHYLRDLLVLASCADARGLTELADGEERAARAVVERTSVPHLHRLFALASRLVDELARSPLPRVHVDVALARMATADTVLPIADILARLERLPQAREPGGTGTPARPPAGRGAPPGNDGSWRADAADAPPPPPEFEPPDLDSTPLGLPTRAAEPEPPPPPREPSPPPREPPPPVRPPRDAPPPARATSLGWEAEPIRPPTPVPAAPTAPAVTPPARATAPGGVAAAAPDAWSRIFEELTRTDKVLSGLLSQAVPVELTPEVVRLAFPEESTAAELLRQPKRAESLVAAAGRVLGGRPRVEVDDRSSDAARAVAERLAAQHAAEARTRQEIMDHPAVREALQTFSGSRVVEVRAGTPGATKGARVR